MKKIIFTSIVMILLLLILTGCGNKKEENNSFSVVTSFYPMYIIAINLCDGIDVNVENMTDTAVGCLHDYTLQTKDLRKVENADMFIINGLGVENFIDKITENRENLYISDTSKADLYLIQDENETNGHVWNNTENYIKQIEIVKEDLIKNNSENTDKYEQNAQNYITKIKELENNRFISQETKYVVSCNEALEYILDEANLEVIPVYTEHEESTLSGNMLSDIINEVKDKNINAIFIDKNDDRTNAELIAKETGAQIYVLDSGLSGDLDKNAYIETMNKNYDILKEAIK